ncbi:MAG: hypothetical protein ED557_13250 [Balneola sp.]|nr:MAG: hypothetical protein ED557_13250 [Balneola sp.]
MPARANSHKILVFFIVFISGWLIPDFVQAQSATARVSKDSLTVGELFDLSITLRVEQSYQRIIFPDSTSFPPIIDFNSSRQYRITDFADSVLYQLQFFADRDISLSPFPVILVSASDTSVVYTNPISLYFKTVLPSEDAELKPLKPIFDLSGFPWAWAIIILGLIIAAIAAYYTFFKKKEEIEEPEVIELVPFFSPLDGLEKELARLKQEYDLAATKDYKYFYSTLSDSIRQYFEDLYNIPALESTSRELFRYMDAFGVDHEMIKSTRQVLNRSDMVKFAKFTPTLDDAWSCYQYAVDFLDRARTVDASRISRKKALFESEQHLANQPQEAE